jgi:hypothetical protein
MTSLCFDTLQILASVRSDSLHWALARGKTERQALQKDPGVGVRDSAPSTLPARMELRCPPNISAHLGDDPAAPAHRSSSAPVGDKP